MAKDRWFIVESRSYGRKLQGVKVRLIGFPRLPAEFSNPDRGFPFGKTLLETLASQFKTYRLQVCNKGKCALRKIRRTTVVTLPIAELKRIGVSRYPLRKDLDQRVVWNMLSTNFPRAFPGNRSVYAYTRGMFHSLLSSLTLRQIAQEDTAAISDFVSANPQLLGKAKSLKQQAAVAKAPIMRAIVDEMQQGINANEKEQYWQEFVRKNYLYLSDEYVQMIEKQNLGVAIRIPDFLLVTSDGYVDVLELKTPKTPLLRLDDSHDTYYWSQDLAQAISQTENYLDTLNKNATQVADYLRRQGMEIDIIRPRAFVVCGNTQSFAKKEMLRQFRLLNRPMANIEIITYSDLLTRARNKLITIEKTIQRRGR